MGNACLNGESGSCNVTGGVGYGYEGDYSPTNCPIDDYVWLLIFPAALLGYFMVRKKLG